MSQASRREPELPPHRPLTDYYPAKETRHEYVMDLFEKSAPHYNTIEGIFLNGGLLYRRISLKLAGLKPGMKVLDVAIGTAAVSRGAVKVVGKTGRVIGVDPSPGMLKEARKHFAGPLARGVAQSLPFASEQFDFVTMGIALRHVADLAATFHEYHRVLKPGGRLWILEGHVPKSKLGQALTRFAWAKVIPALTYMSTRSRDAKVFMEYYWDTVEQCVPPDRILAAIAEAGFKDARFQVVVPGAFAEYTATRPKLA